MGTEGALSRFEGRFGWGVGLGWRLGVGGWGGVHVGGNVAVSVGFVGDRAWYGEMAGAVKDARLIMDWCWCN